MGEHHNQTENIIQAISLTQKLRTSVGKVFDNLGDGFAVSQGNEKALLNTFQQSLLAVNNDFRYMYDVAYNYSSYQNPSQVPVSMRR